MTRLQWRIGLKNTSHLSEGRVVARIRTIDYTIDASNVLAPK